MNILSNIFAGVVLFFGSIFAHHALAPTQKLGSVTPIQTQVFFLSGAGINNNATSVLLTSMAYSNGALVNMADLGTIGYATIDPGFPNKEEQVSFSNIVQNTNGSALLTGVIRGLAFNPGTQGCNGSSTLAVSHAGGAQFVLSNTACFYTNYAGLSNNNTFTGTNNFSSTPTVNTTSTASNALVTYQQLASTSFSGTVNASTTQKGIIQLATPAQIASGTALGSTGAALVVPNSASSLTASTTDVSVIASGTLDPSFVLNANYSLGSTTVQSLTSASTTLNGTTTVNGNTTFTNFPTVATTSPTSSLQLAPVGYVNSSTPTLYSTSTSLGANTTQNNTASSTTSTIITPTGAIATLNTWPCSMSSNNGPNNISITANGTTVWQDAFGAGSTNIGGVSSTVTWVSTSTGSIGYKIFVTGSSNTGATVSLSCAPIQTYFYH